MTMVGTEIFWVEGWLLIEFERNPEDCSYIECDSDI